MTVPAVLEFAAHALPGSSASISVNGFQFTPSACFSGRLSGKTHDVHVKTHHDMVLAITILGGWGHGIGQNAIQPIINPRLRCPGDYNYPGEDELFVVLGVELAGEARAYRLNDMFDSEVVDDTIGDAHIAVTY